MPTLVLRGLPTDLAARLASYRSETGASPREAALALLEIGLDCRDARKRGGAAVWDDTTAEERRQRTEKMRAARWAKA